MSKKISKTKRELIQLSKEAKALREELQSLGNPKFDDLSINDVLVMMYQKDTGAKMFKTYNDWKKAGFQVKKGEKSYRIWGKPIKAKIKDQSAENQDEERKYQFWPMCALFNENQIERLEDKPEENDSDQETTFNASENPYISSNFSERQESRRDRLEARAQKKSASADDAINRSRDLVSGIPFGQPILVGHHSERAHRRAIDKSWDLLGRSCQLSDQAKALERKAQGVGTGGIASDDPEALQKLEAQLRACQKNQELMKLINKEFRSGGWDGITAISKDLVEELKASNPSYYKKPFPSYSLQNNNANINRIKKRIKSIKELHSSNPIEFENDDFKLYVEEGRVRFEFFGGKPSDEARSLLKGRAFRFSRYSNEWVRKVTNNAIKATEGLLIELRKLESIY